MKTGEKRVNLNYATPYEIMIQLPDLTLWEAEKIVKFIDEREGISDFRELRQLTSINEKLLNQLQIKFTLK